MQPYLTSTVAINITYIKCILVLYSNNASKGLYRLLRAFSKTHSGQLGPDVTESLWWAKSVTILLQESF